ncbi:hypothetical protein PTKIN_Ptkin14bG0113300 [Pterospermum kingtungense]
MSVIGEATLSAFLELLGKLASSALNFVTDHKQVYEQLKEWQSKLPSIQAVLNDAEEKQIKNEGVKKWLADLQDLAYDVDDVLDELPMKLYVSSCKKIKLKPALVSKMVSKIKEITARLNNLESQKGVLELREISGGARSKQGTKARLQPTSLVDEAHVCGRENEKREILELLKSCNAGGEYEVPVISILGMGGMGKTTLAQLVYNDASIKEFFDLKAWVCVSEDFDAVNITKTILRSNDAGSCDYNDLNLLQVKLNFHLDKLSHADSLSIFTQHALSARDFKGHPELKEVGENIVRSATAYLLMQLKVWINEHYCLWSGGIGKKLVFEVPVVAYLTAAAIAAI